MVNFAFSRAASCANSRQGLSVARVSGADFGLTSSNRHFGEFLETSMGLHSDADKCWALVAPGMAVGQEPAAQQCWQQWQQWQQLSSAASRRGSGGASKEEPEFPGDLLLLTAVALHQGTVDRSAASTMSLNSAVVKGFVKAS